MTSPSISVIIPTHNRPGGLAAAVNSVFNQTLLPKELIVVDDGSTPPVSKEVFIGCPGGLSTKLLRNDSPKGANNARNRGIKEATGEWIAFLDDDDEFFPEKIDVISQAINEKGAPVDVIYHPAHIFMVNEGLSYISKPKCFGHQEDIFRQLLIKNHIGGTPMVVVRKSALLSVGMFDEQLPALQDYELWLRLAKNNQRFFLLEKPLTKYHHITKAKSITGSEEAGLKALSAIEQKYADAFAGLTKKERSRFEMRKQNRLIRIALLGKKNFLASKLFWNGFVKFKKIKYLAGAMVSLLGSKAVFWLRANR